MSFPQDRAFVDLHRNDSIVLKGATQPVAPFLLGRLYCVRWYQVQTIATEKPQYTWPERDWNGTKECFDGEGERTAVHF